MKPHWKTAPERIQRQIEDNAARPVQVVGGHQSAAATWLATMLYAHRFGFAYDPPELSVTAELAELEKAEDRRSVVLFAQQNSVELAEEKKAQLRWDAFAKWRSEPSNEEVAEAARIEREAVAREAAIENRARQIIADEDATRLEKARARARKEIEKS